MLKKYQYGLATEFIEYQNNEIIGKLIQHTFGLLFLESDQVSYYFTQDLLVVFQLTKN